MTAKNLYAYTLQPVPYEVTEAEQRNAQLAIWRSTNKIGTKAWAIMGAVVALSILGLVLIKNYSTIIFWVALVSVAIYFLVRKFGLAKSKIQTHTHNTIGFPRWPESPTQ